MDSRGNRTYSYSLATTWSISFEAVMQNNAQAAKLLQLLAFLNPDRILIDFLVAGREALDNDMRLLMENDANLAKSLLQLEKVSLIKWSRPTKILSVHRLVQTVVKDLMSKMEGKTFSDTIVNICYCSFSREVTNQTRGLCRF